jgi:hypothetical protein
MSGGEAGGVLKGRAFLARELIQGDYTSPISGLGPDCQRSHPLGCFLE